MSIKTIAARYLSSMNKAQFHIEVVNLGGHLKLNIADDTEEVTCYPEEWDRAISVPAPTIKEEGATWEAEKPQHNGHFVQGTGFHLSNPKVGTYQPRPKNYSSNIPEEVKAMRRAKHEADVATRRMARLAEQPKGRKGTPPAKYGKK